MTKLLVEKIRSRWPDVNIIVRGDGGFAIEKLMRWCAKNDVNFVFGLPKNNVLIGNIACEMTRASILYSQSETKQTIFKWFRYRTQKTWDRHRWVIGKAEHSAKGANPRFVVTNLPNSEEIVEPTYERLRINGRPFRQLIEIPARTARLFRIRKSFIARCTVHAAKWKTVSRNSSCACSPIEPVVRNSWRTSFD